MRRTRRPDGQALAGSIKIGPRPAVTRIRHACPVEKPFVVVEHHRGEVAGQGIQMRAALGKVEDVRVVDGEIEAVRPHQRRQVAERVVVNKDGSGRGVQ
jgi:stress response protein YsnF